MPKGDYLKYKIETIQEKLEENDYIWISGEYENTSSKIVVQNKEGYMGLCLIGTLMRGAKVKFFFSKNPYTINNIKKWAKDNTNYELISSTYENANKPLIFKCPKHGEFSISWNKLFNGRKCPKCGNRNTKYSVEEIKEKLETINSNIELISTTYENAFKKLKFKCKVDGFIWDSNWHNILTSGQGCPECKRRSFIGENNPRYNPNLTNEEREKGRNILGASYTEWRTSVFARDNYTCQCCGNNKSGNLNAHHLNGYNWDKEHRTDVNNGITLCKKCHKEFHSVYGYGNNTREQFDEFLKKQNI